MDLSLFVGLDVLHHAFREGLGARVRVKLKVAPQQALLEMLIVLDGRFDSKACIPICRRSEHVKQQKHRILSAGQNTSKYNRVPTEYRVAHRILRECHYLQNTTLENATKPSRIRSRIPYY